MEVSKSDWKLFRTRIGDWQEAYMERLVKEYMDLGDIPVLSYILSDASLAEFDLKGDSVFYLDDNATIVQGAREALIKIGILE